MRIAFVINSLKGYGVQKTIIQLAEVLSKKSNIKIDLLTLNGNIIEDNELNGDILVFESSSSKISRSFYFLNSYYKKNKPNVIFSPFFHYGVFLILYFKIFRLRDVKIVVSSANDLMHSRDTLGSRIVYRMAKVLFKRADKVVSLTTKMGKDFAEILSVPLKNIYKINNPVYNDEILELAKESVNHPFFHGEDRIVIGVGRLGLQKDFLTLVEAFSLLSTKKTKLIILGEGGRRGEIEELIISLKLSNRVSMPGFVKNPYKYISRSDVFVLSSIWEGFGNVIVEALACGTNVVSTNCQCGPEEILENGKYGILVPIKNPKAMATAIERSFKLADSKETLLKRAQCYDDRIIGDQYYKCFTDWNN